MYACPKFLSSLAQDFIEDFTIIAHCCATFRFLSSLAQDFIEDNDFMNPLGRHKIAFLSSLAQDFIEESLVLRVQGIAR